MVEKQSEAIHPRQGRCKGAHLATQQPNALPERLKHIIKGLNAIWRSSLSQGSDCQGGNGLDLLILIIQPMLDNVHQSLHST